MMMDANGHRQCDNCVKANMIAKALSRLQDVCDMGNTPVIHVRMDLRQPSTHDTQTTHMQANTYSYSSLGLGGWWGFATYTIANIKSFMAGKKQTNRKIPGPPEQPRPTRISRSQETCCSTSLNSGGALPSLAYA